MPARNLALSSFSPSHWFTSAVSREKIEKERGKKEKENESDTKERGSFERDSFERTSLTSRPLRISFTVTDIRHGQRSSSSGRRRNRETEKKKKKEAEALDEQKGSRHARHAHEPYFSSSRCLAPLAPPAPFSFPSSSSPCTLVLYIVDRLNATPYIAGKSAHRCEPIVPIQRTRAKQTTPDCNPYFQPSR